MNQKTNTIDPNQIHRAKLALQQALSFIEQFPCQSIEGGRCRADNGEVPTQLAIIREVLFHADDAGLTVPEIAEASGIRRGSVRIVLYTHKEHFEALRFITRRVRWRLIAQQVRND